MLQVDRNNIPLKQDVQLYEQLLIVKRESLITSNYRTSYIHIIGSHRKKRIINGEEGYVYYYLNDGRIHHNAIYREVIDDTDYQKREGGDVSDYGGIRFSVRNVDNDNHSIQHTRENMGDIKKLNIESMEVKNYLT